MLGLVREMRPAVLHLGNLGVGIVRMGPVVIRAFLLPLPIDARQIGARRRPDAGGLGERRHKLLIAFAAVASDDAPQCGVRFQRRGVHADRLAFDQAGRAQTLQDPREDGPMRFERNEPSRPRNRRVVRRCLIQPDPQKSRNANESAARQAIPRSASMPSK